MVLRTNPNKEYVEKMREKIKINDGYCPCQITKSEDTKCMCKSFREQMERNEKGKCHCGLYEIIGE